MSLYVKPQNSNKVCFLFPMTVNKWGTEGSGFPQFSIHLFPPPHLCKVAGVNHLRKVRASCRLTVLVMGHWGSNGQHPVFSLGFIPRRLGTLSTGIDVLKGGIQCKDFHLPKGTPSPLSLMHTPHFPQICSRRLEHTRGRE